MKRFILISLMISIILVLFISPFASTCPDGLEKVTEEKNIAIKETGIINSIMPDYTISYIKHEGLSTSIAGLLGTIITFAAGTGITFLYNKRNG